jgi:hypothetical protein
MSEKCALCDHEPACGFATWQRGDLFAYLCHDDDHSCYQEWLHAEASGQRWSSLMEAFS